jgi:hypothetical protein
LRLIAASAAGAALLAGALGAHWYRSTTQAGPTAKRMLVAPMIGVIEPCIEQPPMDARMPATLTAHCAAPQGSAGALVEASLQGLSAQAHGRFALGYTLPVPLLKLFVRDAAGGWRIDQAMVQRLAGTIRDVQRPLILYLFATHFSAQAPIEDALAQDEANMARTPAGPLGRDSYYDSYVYDWSVASTRNTLTARRQQAMQAVLDAVCRLEPQARARIQGVTLLGELHQLFPDFQAGMGFGSPYRITDYSRASVLGFRSYLQREFGSIARLNRLLGGDYASFDEVDPPSKDIRHEPLRRYTEHIDAFAHGSLPVAGWAHVRAAPPGFVPQVLVYRNGQLAGRAPVQLNRQDVLAARPEFGVANTGWRFDLDYRLLPAGMHRLDLFLEDSPGHLVAMGTRHIAIMDRRQSTPHALSSRPLPQSAPARDGVEFHIDFPREQSAYYYNPLVPLWHAFRARQVTQYLEFFNAQVAGSCLAGVPRYTHQIVPFFNPSWDATRFAIDDSLRPHADLRLGVSLYGEAAYGASFTQWLRRTGQQRYGITEFHPLKAMDAQALERVFEQHARQGAQFLSFFLEPQWEGQRVPRGHNMFAFDPLNPQFGSDALYRSAQQALGQ